MVTSEFRIGNYFYSKQHKKEFRVSEIHISGLGQSDNDYDNFIDIEYVNGIPITPEWLLTFGFEQLENRFTIKTGWYWDVRQDKKQTKMRIKFTSAGNWRVTSPANGSIYLKYIHQLQNLYFALAEREFDINGI